jgi:3-methyladenine DNA glycosylase/8-oxoguanine DNA glycosylase
LDRLLTLSDDEIRACGASWAKVRSLKDLATKVSDGSVKLHLLDQMSDIEVKNHLIQIKGVGPWTAEMFLMFALVREDVFSMGDLGLKKGMMKVYGYRKDPSLAQIEKIVSRWKPYRSYASRILWKSLEIDLA